MNEETQKLGKRIIDMISDYQPSDAVYTLTKVLAACLVVSRVKDTTLEEMAELTHNALLCAMKDYEGFLKELN